MYSPITLQCLTSRFVRSCIRHSRLFTGSIRRPITFFFHPRRVYMTILVWVGCFINASDSMKPLGNDKTVLLTYGQSRHAFLFKYLWDCKKYRTNQYSCFPVSYCNIQALLVTVTPARLTCHLATVAVFRSQKGPLYTENHWIEWQSLTVTLCRFPNTATVTDTGLFKFMKKELHERANAARRA